MRKQRCLWLGFWLGLLVVWSLVSPSASALEVDPFMPSFTRDKAIGGVHAAYVDDFGHLFSNPAGFFQVKEALSLSSFDVEIQDLLTSLTQGFNQYSRNQTIDIADFSDWDGLRGDSSGPLAFGWIGRGLGFGLFNRTYFKANQVAGALNLSLNEDFLAVGGYAFQAFSVGTHKLELGFLGKAFIRICSDQSALPTVISQLVLSDELKAQPFTTLGGIGLDVGLLYHFGDSLTIGAVCRDAYSPVSASYYASGDDFLAGRAVIDEADGLIKPRLDFGIALNPQQHFLSRYLSDLTFLLDYHDFLDLFSASPRNSLLNFAIGLEVLVLDVLSFRFGLADALPSAGVGLDLSFIRCDLAVSGVELGINPGDNRVLSTSLGFSFRL